MFAPTFWTLPLTAALKLLRSEMTCRLLEHMLVFPNCLSEACVLFDRGFNLKKDKAGILQLLIIQEGNKPALKCCCER